MPQPVLPMDLVAFSNAIRDFNNIHRNCKEHVATHIHNAGA
jgi:hypothetical protein